jgi:hypothetical protein
VDTRTLSPQNFEERLIWYGITWTYGFYLVGGLYVMAPVLAWVLLFHLIKKLWFQTAATPAAERIHIPVAVWVWIVAMLAMEIALLAGHLGWELGPAKTLKSSIGWAKGWALMAIFPLVGCLNIRPELIYRAAAIVSLQSLILLPLLLAAWWLRLPEDLYVSPVKLVGGPGPEFFRVSLYDRGYDDSVRWYLFAPWAPALGLVANLYLLCVLREKNRFWFWIGILGCVAMVVASKSRLALLAMAVIPLTSWVLARLTHSWALFLAGGLSVSSGLLAPQLMRLFGDFSERFRAVRAGSSRVRETLARIAIERWRDEAPVWGHGIVERGPHLVEYMPIGSHHSWYGLLFVKGAVGFLALAIPLAWSFVELLLKAQTSREAQTGLAVVLLLFLYTFGENLEILAYLFWPGLVLLGIAHKQPLRNPLASASVARAAI